MRIFCGGNWQFLALNYAMTEKFISVQGSDNVFRDLGFPEAEAHNLLLRAELVLHIRKAIAKLNLTQLKQEIDNAHD